MEIKNVQYLEICTIHIDLNLVNWNNWTFELSKLGELVDFSAWLRIDDATKIGLQENADLLVSLRGAIFFDSKKKGVDQVLISMGIGNYNLFIIDN